jgi:phospholipase A2
LLSTILTANSQLSADNPHIKANRLPTVPIEDLPRIHLIDGGMDNNCPTYVLLHPARKIDVILNMDASSDVQRNTFQARLDQTGSRRKIEFTKRNPEAQPRGKNSPDRFKGMYAQIYDGTVVEERPAIVIDSYDQVVTNPPAAPVENDCIVVHMPLLPNEKAVKDFDPSTAKFSGSFNLVWRADQVEDLVRVSAANFRSGESVMKTALRDAWLRKKARREAREKGT